MLELFSRKKWLTKEIRKHGVTDERVLSAMSQVPRELFIPDSYAYEAYANKPLPIGWGQTISQPLIVAMMTELLSPDPLASVMEIGTGSGYQTCVLSRLFRIVFTIERIPELTRKAVETLKGMKGSSIHFHCADGTAGLPERSPFDRIIVTAAGPEIPKPLLEQLSPDGGILVIPVGGSDIQNLIRVTRSGDSFFHDNFGQVRFVPLIGKHGHS